MTVKFKQDRQNAKVFATIEDLPKLTRRGLRQGMFKVGHSLIAVANREILKGDKTGIVYIRRDRAGRRRRHQSSAPGETHANRSGTLRKSLSFQLRGSSELEFGYGVSSGKEAPEYARAIEFGFEKRNLKPRPSLRNALDAEQGNMTQHFGGGIMKVLK